MISDAHRVSSRESVGRHDRIRRRLQRHTLAVHRNFEPLADGLLFFLPPVELMAHGVHRELHTARQSELV
jgi:hypothetical protein